MTLYKNKYRIKSSRLKDWDYSNNGYYFVTICTKNRRPFFGSIMNEKMQLSKIGITVENEWKRIEQIRENVKLDEWIVMPNHLHGIIIIDNPVKRENDPVETCDSASHNLSNILCNFKSRATRQIREQENFDFAWQSRFYDHIIRSDKSLASIGEYIFNNPMKWSYDEYYVG